MSQILSVALLLVCLILLIMHFVAIKNSTNKNG